MSKTTLIIMIALMASAFLMGCMSSDDDDEEDMEFYLSIESANAFYYSSSNMTRIRLWMYGNGANSYSFGNLQEDWSVIISEGDTTLMEINKDNMYDILGEDLKYIFYPTINTPGSAHVNLDNDNIIGRLFGERHPNKIKFSATIIDRNGKVHNLSEKRKFDYYGW